MCNVPLNDMDEVIKEANAKEKKISGIKHSKISNMINRLDEMLGEYDTPKQTFVRIRYKGKFLVLSNGKTIWKKEGHAKNALRNEFNGIFWHMTREYHLSFKDAREIEEEAFQTLYKTVKFVKV